MRKFMLKLKGDGDDCVNRCIGPFQMDYVI